MSEEPTRPGLKHIAAPRARRLIKKELAVAGRRFGIPVDCDDDRLDVLVTCASPEQCCWQRKANCCSAATLLVFFHLMPDLRGERQIPSFLGCYPIRRNWVFFNRG